MCGCFYEAVLYLQQQLIIYEEELPFLPYW